LLGGLVLWISALYCAPSTRSAQGKGRSEHGGGLYPELAIFGFHAGHSAALSSLVARQSTLMPSFELARQELARRGLELNIKGVHRCTHRLGQQLLIARRCDLQRYRDGQLPAGTELAGKRVCVQIDGGRIRLRKVTRKQKGQGADRQYIANGLPPAHRSVSACTNRPYIAQFAGGSLIASRHIGWPLRRPAG